MKTSPYDGKKWMRIVLLALAFGLVPGMGPTLAQDAGTQEAGAEAPATQEGDEATGEEAAEPEYEWLIDDEGQRYRIEKLRKKRGTYRRIGDDQVRTQWGPVIDVADEDDEYFYYKVYAVEAPERPVETGPTPEEIELVLASYRSTVRDVDRLAFEPIGAGLPKSGQWRNGFELADMNEDGHLDLVHGSPRKPPGSPAIFLGDGQGDFRRWRELELPSFPYDYGDVVVADFNDDGHLDMAFAMHLRGLTAMLGDGKGAFTLWNEGLDFRVPGRDASPAGFTARTLEAADWNGDGLPDLIALGEGPHLVRGGGNQGLKGRQARGLAVYLNQGDGTWKPHYEEQEDNYLRYVFGDELTVGDVDGDGRVDAVSASHVQGRRQILHLARDQGRWELAAIENLRPRAYIHSGVVADLNGDGENDLAIGFLSWELDTWRVGIDLFFAEEDGWRRETLAAREALDRVRSLDVGDVDGDGHLDLAGVTESGWVVLFLGDGRGGFVHEDAPELEGPEGTCKGYHVRLRDVDGDGMAEIFASFAGETAGIIELTHCPSGGSIKAWRPMHRRQEAAKTAQKP